MNDHKVTMSKSVWVASATAFFLILGAVWYASSSVSGVREITVVSKPYIPAAVGRGSAKTAFDDSPAPVVTVSPVNPIISNMASTKQPAKPQPPKQITPRDMFPVGNIAQSTPILSHPFRQIAELFPSFEYEGKVWAATGKFTRESEADLTPTGYELATGQKLYALANMISPDAVLFVRSVKDPSKFAIYRLI